MLNRILSIQPGDLKRLIPFFGLFLMVHMMLTLGDGISLALFVRQVGTEHLPVFYGLIALISFVLIGIYLHFSNKISNIASFQTIIAGSILSFLTSWVMLQWFHGGPFWYGVFFVSREVSFN